jgi:hypothetical protein
MYIPQKHKHYFPSNVQKNTRSGVVQSPFLSLSLSDFFAATARLITRHSGKFRHSAKIA